MKTIKVKLDEKTVEISKLPLGKYADLLKALKQLPRLLKDFQGKSNDEIVERLPIIIGESFDDFIGILVIATDLQPEELKLLGLDEVVRLILAVFEVNNYQEVYKNIKKVTSPQIA